MTDAARPTSEQRLDQTIRFNPRQKAAHDLDCSSHPDATTAVDDGADLKVLDLGNAHRRADPATGPFTLVANMYFMSTVDLL